MTFWVCAIDPTSVRALGAEFVCAGARRGGATRVIMCPKAPPPPIFNPLYPLIPRQTLPQVPTPEKQHNKVQCTAFRTLLLLPLLELKDEHWQKVRSRLKSRGSLDDRPPVHNNKKMMNWKNSAAAVTHTAMASRLIRSDGWPFQRFGPNCRFLNGFANSKGHSRCVN